MQEMSRMGIMSRNHMKCDLAKYLELPGSLVGHLSPYSFYHACL